jgi:putative aldouronate transport system permease protein
MNIKIYRKKTSGFQIAANLILILICVLCVAPFILLVSSSFTDEQTLISSGYNFFPAKFSIYAYAYLMKKTGAVIRSYGMSALVTGLGTLCNLCITLLYAYPLADKNLPGRKFFAFFLFFTMLFSGGLVPSYIMWTRTFHVQNTIFALLIPNLLMNAFNVIMVRTYFQSNIPDAVIEAARIDGAGEFTVLRSVVLPMSHPIIATIGILVGLGYWNDWMNGLYYVNNDRLYTVQVLLTNIQKNIEALKQSAQLGSTSGAAQLPSASVRMALTVLCVFPVLVVYPFVQKFFIGGITVGAVKG